MVGKTLHILHWGFKNGARMGFATSNHKLSHFKQWKKFDTAWAGLKHQTIWNNEHGRILLSWNTIKINSTSAWCEDFQKYERN